MGVHEPTFAILIDDPQGAFDDVVQFYRHNGYEERAGDELREVWMERNRHESSWFTCSMAELPTRIRIQRREDRLQLDYAIETSGQHLTEEDHGFWRRESGRAEAFARGHGELVDLRPEEEARADAVQWEMRTTAMKAAVLVMIVVFLVGIVGMRIEIF